MRSNRIISSLQLLSLVLITFYSEGQHLREETQNFFNQIRNGVYPSIPNAFLFSENENDMLDVLQPFLTDSVHAVRAKANEITYLVSSRSSNTSMRSRGVDVLLHACTDPDSGITGIALDLLKEFDKKDFSLSAKDSLRKLVRMEVPHLERLIKLAGFLDLRDLIPDIRPWSQPGNPAPIRWAAMLSLARMGESAAVAEIMNRVKKLPVNDDLVYEVFPDLIYTRQPGPIAYLVDELQSNEKNCMSADAERETPILCGYRIMEQLAPAIESFPLQLNDSGDIQTDDYTAALENVRQWFRTHKTYTIRNNRY